MSCKNRRRRKGAKRQEVQSQGRYRQIFEGRGRTRHRARNKRSASTSATATTSIFFPITAGSRPISRTTSSSWAGTTSTGSKTYMGYEARSARDLRSQHQWLGAHPQRDEAARQPAGPRHAGGELALPDLAQPSAGFAEQGLPSSEFAELAEAPIRSRPISNPA